MESKEFSKYLNLAETLLKDVRFYDGISHHTVDSSYFAFANKSYKAAYLALKHLIEYMDIFYIDNGLRSVLHQSLIQRFERIVSYVRVHNYLDWSEIGSFF